MPGFDGTGPLGKGPFTGRAMGYCAIKLDSNENENQKSKRKDLFGVPRGGRTSPMGLGPMAGMAAGFYAGYPLPGYMNPVVSRRFVPLTGTPAVNPYGLAPYSYSLLYAPVIPWRGRGFWRLGFNRGFGRGRGLGHGRSRFGY